METYFFQFSIAKNVFIIFEKMDEFNKNKQKSYRTKYLKTHVQKMISKVVFPHSPSWHQILKTVRMLVTIF